MSEFHCLELEIEISFLACFRNIAKMEWFSNTVLLRSPENRSHKVVGNAVKALVKESSSLFRKYPA